MVPRANRSVHQVELNFVWCRRIREDVGALPFHSATASAQILQKQRAPHLSLLSFTFVGRASLWHVARPIMKPPIINLRFRFRA
jgi:hypothetical protein